MIKLVAFFLVLLALAFGFSTLADTPGHFLLQWGETEYRVSLITGVIALSLFAIGLMVLWSLFRLIFRLPGILGFASRMRRQARGQQAVSRGLVAIGTGDSRLAQRYAQESLRLLGKEPLPLLLKAQAAQLSGDAKGAEEAFRTMLDEPETRSLGLRGLYVEAERRNDSATARLLAEEALNRTPDAAWASEAVLGFKAAAQDWRGAIALVDQSISRRLIGKNEGRAQRAVLLAAAVQEAFETAPDEALSLALEALRIAPGLVPAAVISSRRLSAKGDFSRASKIVEVAWKDHPHPDLAEAYLNLRHGDSALDRLKRARYLLRLTPSAREARFAIARAALDAREFGAAREALVLEKPTVRACLLMAELEETESGNQGLVRAWLARASRAPREPEWVADGVVSADWSAVSPVTGKIGAFEWRDPPQASEDHLRARIDADRFETVPEIAPPAEVEAVPEPEPPPPPADPQPASPAKAAA
ncbi:MAG TPA: heme biosynthesis HemY N-terminal domain-containing protein, partial [Rhabdaerophilum sp.]|nr:heme biosynthesis HemY N-terminal domain-containing protein [Rhabdaerophilum sp.]